jgi:hypothetical protein
LPPSGARPVVRFGVDAAGWPSSQTTCRKVIDHPLSPMFSRWSPCHFTRLRIA